MNTDPFIIVNYLPGKNNRTEVHLPKHTSTILANKSLTGTKADAYFVDKDGNHPFALEIPLPSIADPKHSKIFVPATEGKKIDEDFPTSNRGQQATVRIHKTGICIANKVPNESLRLDSL